MEGAGVSKEQSTRQERPWLGQSDGSLSNAELQQAALGIQSSAAGWLWAFLCSHSTSALLQHLQQDSSGDSHPCSRLWFRTCSEYPVQCLLMLVSVFPSLPVHSQAGPDHLLPAPSHNLPVSPSAAPDARWHSSSHPLSQHKGCSQRFVIPSTVVPPCFHRKGNHSPPQMFFTTTAMG